MQKFKEIRPLDAIAENILQKRYYRNGEKSWKEIINRVINFIISKKDKRYNDIYDMLLYRYFIPNSPCLVNANTKINGLSACFVVDFKDSIEEIYKTKLEFALIAKKGGGCGTTLSHLRPENDPVQGSSHGYAGGAVKFFDTICNDMKAMTQAGFREMAMMGTMTVYHPDILKFITAKGTEGMMHTTNISVVVDKSFISKVKNNETYWTTFNGKRYKELNAREVFEKIVEGAWKNGEPGLIFDEKVNNSPYQYSNQKIESTNPCGEVGLPPNGVCNLGSLDLSKFYDPRLDDLDYELFEKAIRLSVYFLDKTVDVNEFPTRDITQWAKDNRPVGLGVMALADYFLQKKIAYGSEQSLIELEKIMSFLKKIAYDESEKLGKSLGIPKQCKKLPKKRRNITVLSVAPTGSISLLAGCSNGIEPIFSELTQRKDKTGEYQLKHSDYDKPYFRCAVSSNGGIEVTWKEHILIQNMAQKYVDSGVSKTINFPNHTKKQTIYDAFIMAADLPYIKGITVYRNGSREIEVLSPKNIKKDKCPECDGNLIKEGNCKHCEKCNFSLCEI